jgi:tetratricopeptide (TPR) repeat protein
LAEVEQIPAPDREAQLLSALNREPFLIVLDGLERLLIAYARMDAAHLSDDDYDRQTANYVANAYGLPASAAQSFTGEHRLRKTADPRAGAFLRKLSTVRAARILVSTRLYPADLQTVTSELLSGCDAIFLRGLSDDDGLSLWRAFGATGPRDQLLPAFRRVDNHPLLIQALAGEVARFRRAPGDFERWLKAHPDFDPFRDIPLVQVKSHVLDFALRGLARKARQVLNVIAAFTMPARYDTLTALLISKRKKLFCRSERELDVVLTELEDRGLVGWDKRANRYDLHPIVRGVIWQTLGRSAQRSIQRELSLYFESVVDSNSTRTESIDDLSPAIELYRTLVALNHLYEAYTVFSDRLDRATHRLCASKLRLELLRPLIETTHSDLPRLNSPEESVDTLNALGRAYADLGHVDTALHYLHSAHSLSMESPILGGPYSSFLRDLSRVSLFGGRIFGAQHHASAAVPRLVRKYELEINYPENLATIAIALAARGLQRESEVTVKRARRVVRRTSVGADSVIMAFAQASVWFRQFDSILPPSLASLAPIGALPTEGDAIRAARLRGELALGLGDLEGGTDGLHNALSRARAVGLVQEELPSLIALAEICRRQGDWKAAHSLLDDVWDFAERGPYPLFHADACNVLAQIERDAGNLEQAIAAATQAYRLAWCDGPPFAYHWGLVAAQKHLRELGAPEPEMPPFDESKFEPMPEVEIDPDDEFHAGMSETDD